MQYLWIIIFLWLFLRNFVFHIVFFILCVCVGISIHVLANLCCEYYLRFPIIKWIICEYYIIHVYLLILYENGYIRVNVFLLIQNWSVLHNVTLIQFYRDIKCVQRYSIGQSVRHEFHINLSKSVNILMSRH